MSRRDYVETRVKELRRPDEGEMLGVAVQMLGYDRLRVKCLDGTTRLCRIPGRMKKKMWIHVGDIVLVAAWDFDDKRADILWRYTRDEVKRLEGEGILKLPG